MQVEAKSTDTFMYQTLFVFDIFPYLAFLPLVLHSDYHFSQCDGQSELEKNNLSIGFVHCYYFVWYII